MFPALPRTSSRRRLLGAGVSIAGVLVIVVLRGRIGESLELPTVTSLLAVASGLVLGAAVLILPGRVARGTDRNAEPR